MRTIPALVLVAILAACAGTDPRDSNQPAIAAAIERGAKEMNCREEPAH